MKHPPLHNSPEAARWRRAARAWVKAVDDISETANSFEIAELPEHREFFEASRAYVEAVQRTPGWLHEIPAQMLPEPSRTFNKDLDPTVGPVLDLIASIPFSSTASTIDAKRWRCKLCKRDKFTRPTGHNCVGGYRKHNLKFEAVVDKPTPEEPAHG